MCKRQLSTQIQVNPSSGDPLGPGLASPRVKINPVPTCQSPRDNREPTHEEKEKRPPARRRTDIRGFGGKEGQARGEARPDETTPSGI